MNRFFFDTYAIIEILRGNQDYKNYIDSEIIINNFTFAELCYNLIKKEQKDTERHLTDYSKYIVSVNSEWIKEAMKFRIKWKDRDVSIADCVGYIMAKELGIKFLTGDKEFEKLDNVEFVK
ncbi:MAG: PIN domain-containing protein [Nanoarchaeota archaeon]